MVQVEFLKFQNQVNKGRGVNQNSNFPCNKGKLEFFGKCLLKLSVCKQKRLPCVVLLVLLERKRSA